jgi:hypothetical protein
MAATTIPLYQAREADSEYEIKILIRLPVIMILSRMSRKWLKPFNYCII